MRGHGDGCEGEGWGALTGTAVCEFRGCNGGSRNEVQRWERPRGIAREVRGWRSVRTARSHLGNESGPSPL